jgi:hypothetical protein
VQIQNTFKDQRIFQGCLAVICRKTFREADLFALNASDYHICIADINREKHIFPPFSFFQAVGGGCCFSDQLSAAAAVFLINCPRLLPLIINMTTQCRHCGASPNQLIMTNIRWPAQCRYCHFLFVF